MANAPRPVPHPPPPRHNPIAALAALLPLSMLASCTPSGERELLAYMEQTRSDATQRSRIEPLPEYIPYERLIYSADDLRSPFASPRARVDESKAGHASAAGAPDLSRPREFLERFNLAELAMVGTIERDGRRWALIRDGRAAVHRVTIGNYLGRNHGQIKQISEAGIDIIEVLNSGRDGWIERPQKLALQ